MSQLSNLSAEDDLLLKAAQLCADSYKTPADLASFLKDPVYIDRNPNVAIVGKISYGFGDAKETATVVVFRGTVGYENWLQNIEISLNDQGKHKGFEAALDNVRSGVNDAVNKCGNQRLIVVGHSLGGAMAELYAHYKLNELNSRVHVTTITFGQPPAGNEAFAKEIQTLREGSRLRSQRYTILTDLVPHALHWRSDFVHTIGPTVLGESSVVKLAIQKMSKSFNLEVLTRLMNSLELPTFWESLKNEVDSTTLKNLAVEMKESHAMESSYLDAVQVRIFGSTRNSQSGQQMTQSIKAGPYLGQYCKRELMAKTEELTSAAASPAAALPAVLGPLQAALLIVNTAASLYNAYKIREVYQQNEELRKYVESIDKNLTKRLEDIDAKLVELKAFMESGLNKLNDSQLQLLEKSNLLVELLKDLGDQRTAEFVHFLDNLRVKSADPYPSGYAYEHSKILTANDWTAYLQDLRQKRDDSLCVHIGVLADNLKKAGQSVSNDTKASVASHLLLAIELFERFDCILQNSVNSLEDQILEPEVHQRFLQKVAGHNFWKLFATSGYNQETSRSNVSKYLHELSLSFGEEVEFTWKRIQDLLDGNDDENAVFEAYVRAPALCSGHLPLLICQKSVDFNQCKTRLERCARYCPSSPVISRCLTCCTGSLNFQNFSVRPTCDCPS
jgi:hypothetical protein